MTQLNIEGGEGDDPPCGVCGSAANGCPDCGDCLCRCHHLDYLDDDEPYEPGRPGATRDRRSDERTAMTQTLIDPDCRAGKHSSCVGGPCECECHHVTQYDPAREALARIGDRAARAKVAVTQIAWKQPTDDLEVATCHDLPALSGALEAVLDECDRNSRTSIVACRIHDVIRVQLVGDEEFP